MPKVYVNKVYNQCYILSEYLLDRPPSITNAVWDWDEVTNTVKFTHTVPTKAEPPVRKKLEDYM